MKKIRARFVAESDAELCASRLSPNVISAFVRSASKDPYPANSYDSNDCGLNAFWGVMASYQSIESFDFSENDRKFVLTAYFDASRERDVIRTIRDSGGKIM